MLRALTDGQPLGYLLDARVLRYVTEQGQAAQWRALLADRPQEVVWSEAELTARWAGAEWAGLPPAAGKPLREGLALGAYHAQRAWRPVGVLLGGDVPQWEHVEAESAPRRVHEGGHYKKLLPAVAYFRALRARFLGRFWRFYAQLRADQAARTRHAVGETTRKLGVNFPAYVRDRLRCGGTIPPPGDLVGVNAATLKLTPA